MSYESRCSLMGYRGGYTYRNEHLFGKDARYTAVIGARGSGRVHFWITRETYERCLIELIRLKLKNPLWRGADELIDKLQMVYFGTIYRFT